MAKLPQVRWNDFGVPPILGNLHIAMIRIPTMGWMTIKHIPCLDPRHIKRIEREREQDYTTEVLGTECTERLSC